MNEAPRRVRHELRVRRLQVVRVERLSVRFMRVVLAGPELDGFLSPGFDDHVKLLFADPATGERPVPVVENGALVWPSPLRPAMRDYTPRHYDAQAGTLAIDFALHEAGPATAWAQHAQVGDSLVIAGPRGSFLIPTDADWELLVGDDTAVPAIARRLEELPATARATVVVEVEAAREQLELPSAARVDVHWVHRQGRAAGEADGFLAALDALEWPSGTQRAWVACEATVARTLRRYLIERGVEPKRVKAAGYWRRGVAASHEPIDD